jgi:hypothetical protein
LVADEVDQYLWAAYERSPTKQDSTGDFTWKDPAAAANLGMSLKTYVIGGMDPDLRELLYHAGLAMDAARIHWTILSAFRDDYRQTLHRDSRPIPTTPYMEEVPRPAAMGTAVLSTSKTRTVIPIVYGTG